MSQGISQICWLKYLLKKASLGFRLSQLLLFFLVIPDGLHDVNDHLSFIDQVFLFMTYALVLGFVFMVHNDSGTPQTIT